jgi:Flp pilus assembly protein TadG
MARLMTGSGRKRGERGAELIEFAFALPLLVFVVVGIIDFGFLFRDYEILTNAAREGARLRSLADDYSTEDVQARVAAYAAASGLTGTVTTSVVPTDITFGANTVAGFTVTAQYPHTFQFLGPIAIFFGGSFGTITLTATSTMRQERQAIAP